MARRNIFERIPVVSSETPAERHMAPEVKARIVERAIWDLEAKFRGAFPMPRDHMSFIMDNIEFAKNSYSDLKKCLKLGHNAKPGDADVFYNGALGFVKKGEALIQKSPKLI